MKLGNLQLRSNLILAPMSGVTDYPFRQLARKHGCGLAFTEMVSAEGFLRKSKPFLKMGRGDHPVSVQLFGSNPDVLAEAAEMAETHGADGIDINMGCPVEKVIKTGAGVDLMRFPEKVKAILMKVRKRIKVPFTIKIRSGWDKEHMNAVEISKIAEDFGVDGISLHPRTKVQGFHGRADWNLIGEVKRAVSIPVIGNGDVTTPYLAEKMSKETECDGLMIGRGALGNPWIFNLHSLSPSLEERLKVIDQHYSLLREHYGEERALKEIRRHMVWYTKGLPFNTFFRLKLSEIKKENTLFEVIRSYFDSIQRRDQWQSFKSAESRSITGQEERAT